MFQLTSIQLDTRERLAIFIKGRRLTTSLFMWGFQNKEYQATFVKPSGCGWGAYMNESRQSVFGVRVAFKQSFVF